MQINDPHTTEGEDQRAVVRTLRRWDCCFIRGEQTEPEDEGSEPDPDLAPVHLAIIQDVRPPPPFAPPSALPTRATSRNEFLICTLLRHANCGFSMAERIGLERCAPWLIFGRKIVILLVVHVILKNLESPSLRNTSALIAAPALLVAQGDDTAWLVQMSEGGSSRPHFMLIAISPAWPPHCNKALPACNDGQRRDAFRVQILLDEGSRRVWVAVRWLYRADEVEAGILPPAWSPAEREQAVFFSTWDDLVDAAALLHPVKVPAPLAAHSLVAGTPAEP